LSNYSYKYVISVPLAIGLTNATRAFALMIGPFFISKWVNKQNLFYIFIAQGCTIILWAYLQHTFYIGLLGIFLTGITSTTLWSFTYAVLQEHIQKRYLGRVLAYNEMFYMLTTVVTTLFIGSMASYISLASITSILGFAFILTAFYYKHISIQEYK
jgi:MFS family permease